MVKARTSAVRGRPLFDSTQDAPPLVLLKTPLRLPAKTTFGDAGSIAKALTIPPEGPPACARAGWTKPERRIKTMNEQATMPRILKRLPAPFSLCFEWRSASILSELSGLFAG